MPLKGFLAALMMFTRLPLWKIVNIDKKYYTEVLKYWPLVGYLTGITTATTFWLASLYMPVLPASVLAIIARLLLTGALHEDGLADFFDAFGSGRDREKILAIMKDSHIGCYGTISLIAYFLLYTSFLYVLDPVDAFPLILAADVFSKFITAVMINSLPYVRKEQESKVQLLYRKTGWLAFACVFIVSIFPFYFLKNPVWLFAIPLPVLTSFLFRGYLKRKIGGYTGDCCGAAVLITEQMCYLGIVILYCL